MRSYGAEPEICICTHKNWTATVAPDAFTVAVTVDGVLPRVVPAEALHEIAPATPRPWLRVSRTNLVRLVVGAG